LLCWRIGIVAVLRVVASPVPAVAVSPFAVQDARRCRRQLFVVIVRMGRWGSPRRGIFSWGVSIAVGCWWSLLV
jgi:hypothetical protein